MKLDNFLVPDKLGKISTRFEFDVNHHHSYIKSKMKNEIHLIMIVKNNIGVKYFLCRFVLPNTIPKNTAISNNCFDLNGERPENMGKN